MVKTVIKVITAILLVGLVAKGFSSIMTPSICSSQGVMWFGDSTYHLPSGTAFSSKAGKIRSQIMHGRYCQHDFSGSLKNLVINETNREMEKIEKEEDCIFTQASRDVIINVMQQDILHMHAKGLGLANC